MTVAETAVPIYGDQDFYVPYFEVHLGGAPLNQDIVHDIIQVTYKDNIDEIDSFDIDINNWDADTRDFKYVDSRTFDPGKRIELWMGYFGKDSLRLMIRGEITSLRPDFSSGGQPRLTVSGLNLLHRLRTEQISKAYEDLTDSQIAREVCGRLKITPLTDPAAEAAEQPYTYIVQDKKYDILFLMERARRIGYDLFVIEDPQTKESTLYFGPSVNVKKVAYQLVYGLGKHVPGVGQGTIGPSLVQFQPTLVTANQVSEVTVRGWDPKHKKEITHTATRSDLKIKDAGLLGRQDSADQSFGERREIISDRPVNSLQEARTLALETLTDIAKDMVKGNGSTVGLPDLRAGRIIFLDGLGARFSGRYFVTSTTHTSGDGGYTTSFECRREELQ
jgi:Bacteriophage probable baseplate hub protein